MEANLKIDISQRNGTTYLTVQGEVDLATAATLDAQITAAATAETGRIVVDLDHVRFMDSSGLQVLLAHVFSEQDGSRRIELTRGSPQVRRLFRVSGMFEQLPFTSEH